LHIFGLKLHHFLEVNFHFMLLTGSIFADDDRMIRLGSTIQATGQRKNLERGELGAIVGKVLP